jgi:hypothetical protein
MRVKELKYNNRNSLIIYMTEVEKNDQILKKKIDEYKRIYKDVSVFISGNNKIEDVLIKMVQEKM